MWHQTNCTVISFSEGGRNVFLHGICITCVYVVCVCVSSGPRVGQHVSAPAARLSQAVISTYHSDRPARADTGTHNPRCGPPLPHVNIQHRAARPLFSFGPGLVRSHGASNRRVSPASFSNCNKGVLRLLGLTARPGKSHFSNCRVCETSAPSSTM